MIRKRPPYNGKRFLLNLHTNETHDLDDERKGCKIDEISVSHVKMFDTLFEAKEYVERVNLKRFNGCRWYLKEHSID